MQLGRNAGTYTLTLRTTPTLNSLCYTQILDLAFIRLIACAKSM
jgi:hypothetical protein